MNTSSSRYVMYILINQNLQISKGEIATQVAKISANIIDEIVSNAFTISNNTGYKLSDLSSDITCYLANIKDIERRNILSNYVHYTRWKKDNSEIIVLKASEEMLLSLIHLETNCMKLLADPISTLNAGKTKIPAYSLTAVGFFPRNNLKEKMAKFKLL